MGEAGKARRILLELLAEKPSDNAVLRELGKAAMDEQDFTEAEKWLRRARDVDPYDHETLYPLARCLFRRKKKEEAEKLFARAKRLEADWNRLLSLNQKVGKAGRDPALRLEAGKICLRNGQPQEALRWFSGALQIDPNHKATHQALAAYYQKVGKPELAAQHRRLARGRKRGQTPALHKP
jgi:Flp pilus assembly protein TadD